MMTPEEAVIGACLLNPDVIREAVQHVMPSDFERWQARDTYQAIIDLHAMHQPVDIVTVASRLRDVGSRVPVADLHGILAEVPTAANVGFYAAQVRESSIRRALNRVSIRLAQDAANEMLEPGVALANANASLKAVRDDAPDTGGLALRKLSDVMAAPDDYDWIIQKLFERGDRFILTGPEGKGKSMLMRQMAIFTAAGIHPFWLTPLSKPVNVMVIDRENTERQWRRKSRTIWDLAQRFGKYPVDVNLSCDLQPMDITRDSDLGKIHRMLDDNPTDLLFLGPLYKLVPRAVQTDDEAAPMQAALDSLRGRGVAIITEAHSGHERGQSLRPLGSSAWLRWPEFGRGLRQDVGNPARWTLEQWRGDRDERSFPGAVLRTNHPVPWLAENAPEALVRQFALPEGQIDLGGDNVQF